MQLLHLGMLEIDDPSDETVEAFGRMMIAMAKLRELNVSWMRAGDRMELQVCFIHVHTLNVALCVEVRRRDSASHSRETSTISATSEHCRIWRRYTYLRRKFALPTRVLI